MKTYELKKAKKSLGFFATETEAKEESANLRKGEYRIIEFDVADYDKDLLFYRWGNKCYSFINK